MTGLVKRGATYYVRVRIPADLRRYFDNRNEICKSLKTFCDSDATNRCKIAIERAHRFFDLLRSQMLSDTQMRGLAIGFVRQGLLSVESWRFDGQAHPEISSWLTLPTDTLEQMVSELKSDLAVGVPSRIEPIMDAFIAKSDILELQKGSDDYRRMTRHLGIALLQFLEVEKERREGNYTNNFDRDTYDISPRRQVVNPPTELAAAPQSTITEVISAYIAEKTAAGRWEAKTVQQNQASLNLMVGILGDQPIKDVTHHEMLKVRETIRQLPGNRAKKKPYREKSLDAIGRMKGVKPMSTTTCNNILTRIASFWNWALRHEYIERTPAHDLLVPTSKRADEERAVYTQDELQKLVDAVAIHSNPKGRPERIWVTLIALYSGMRPNEIAQLHTDDILIEDGIPCFRIADTHPWQKVKNKNARRIIPIHPVILDAGFLSYFDRVSSKKVGLVFPLLRKHRDGYFAYLGRWFQSINREYVTTDKAKVFYSLRHNFISALKDAQASSTLISEIVGHAVPGETMGRYGKRYNPGILLDVLKMVDHRLDLSKIQDAASLTLR